MRIKIVFDSKKIPMSYNMLFLSIIKECLKESDEDMFKKVFDSTKILKNFTFAVKPLSYKLEDKHFIDMNKIELTISTNDPELLINLYNGFTKKNTYTYKEYSLDVKDIEIKNLKQIENNIVILNAISPICIKDKNNRFLTFEDNNFEKELNYICNQTLKKCCSRELKRPLEFKNINMKSVVVKLNLRHFDKDFNIISSKGNFYLAGDTQDINDLYRLGIGFRRSEGFGCVNLIKG